jgi:hypothetical protein
MLLESARVARNRAPGRGGHRGRGARWRELGDVRRSRLKLRSTGNVGACVYVQVASFTPGRECSPRPPFVRCRKGETVICCVKSSWPLPDQFRTLAKSRRSSEIEPQPGTSIAARKLYPITSSARASNTGGSCRPSCRAVFWFTTNSKSVGA